MNKIEYKDIKHAIDINIPPITPAIVMGVEEKEKIPLNA